MSTRTVLHLFYSQKQESLFAKVNQKITDNRPKLSVHIYKTMDRRLVEVTEAKSSSDPSKFDDAIYLGETLAPGNWFGSREAVETEQRSK